MKIFNSLLFILLAGCSYRSNLNCPTVKVVKIPIYSKLDIPYREYPRLLVDELKQNSSNSDIISAYYLDNLTLKNELNYFRELLYKENKYEYK